MTSHCKPGVRNMDQATKPTERPELRTAYVRYGRWLIPSNSSSVVQFYMNYLFIPRSRKEFFQKSILRMPSLLDRLGRHHHGLGPRHALRQLRSVARTERNTAIAARSELERKCGKELLTTVERELVRLGQAVTGPLIPLSLNHRVDSTRPHLVLFLFGQGSHYPCAVAKVAEHEEQVLALKHEFEALATVNSLLDQNPRCGSPTPISLIRYGALNILLEAFVPGRTMYFQTRTSWYPGYLIARHLARAGEWLIAFQKATRGQEENWDERHIREYVIRPLEAFRRSCEASADEQAKISDVISFAHRLCGKRISLVARHGDFWSNNLIVNNDTVIAVDWEQYRERSTPFHDLFMFSTSYGLLYPWRLGQYAGPAAAFRGTYTVRSRLRRLVREYLLNHCSAIGVSPEFLGTFLPVFLAERALEESHNFEADSPDRPREWRALFREYVRVSGAVSFV